MRRLAKAGAVKLAWYLKQCGNTEILKTYSAVLPENAGFEDVVLAEAEADDYNEEQDALILYMISMCGDNPVAETLLQLSVLAALENVRGALDAVSSGNGNGVTLETACRIAMDGKRGVECLELVQDAFERFELLFIDDANKDVLKKQHIFDYRLFAALQGIDKLPATLNDLCGYMTPYDSLQQIYGVNEAYEGFKKRVIAGLQCVSQSSDANKGLTVIVSGERESGRFLHISHCAQECNYGLVIIDYREFENGSADLTTLKHVFRECFLRGYALAIINVSENKDLRARKLISQIERQYFYYFSFPLFISSAGDFKYAPFTGADYVSYELGKLSRTESVQIWNGYLDKTLVSEDFELEGIVSNLRLSAGQIKRVINSMKIIALSGKMVTEKDIFSLCYQILDDGRYNSIKRMKTDYYFSDLSLDPKNMQILERIRQQVSCHRIVMDEWGMQKKYSYGRAVSVLLAGPPGTGKTMAATALANELGLELYKVDLSQVVDKYIGETQKRLEDIFVKAENTNMVLFFDEADAIMGKRSETKDSHDKYANSEVAYILQRIEEFDGIVIMATNYVQNIDPAFARRIRYILNIQMPTAEVRYEIWKNLLEGDISTAKDIDLDFLAEQFELSGGNIKNIVLNAAYRAATEKVPVSMSHLINSIHLEFSKDNRALFSDTFGKYQWMLEW